MAPIDIRDTTLADIGPVADIYADAVRNGTASYELEPPALSEMIRRFETIVADGFPYLSAIADGKLVGYAYASSFRQRPAYRFIVENSVYVAPGLKGSGIGRRLMQALIERSTALGFRQMIAVIGDGRADSASVLFHERLGFRHAGRLEGSGYKHDRWLDTVLMQLQMNGGTGSDPDPDSLPERKFRAGRS